jgi:hypothetical protein
VLCRLARGGNNWSIDTCGPDPKETQPRPPPPSPADVTPDSKIPAPTERPPTARELTTQPDPGSSPTSP